MLAYVAMNDTVTTDSTKSAPAALVAQNDTVTTDSTKAQPAKPAALVAMIEEKDTTQTKDAKTTPSTCDKKAGEKAIQALNAMRNHRLTTLIFLILKEENVPAFSSYFPLPQFAFRSDTSSNAPACLSGAYGDSNVP